LHAIQLKKAGFEDFTIFEAADAGGERVLYMSLSSNVMGKQE
jgi:cation diffusion facilitator CzcD-associated flavoprotein CzcO